MQEGHPTGDTSCNLKLSTSISENLVARDLIAQCAAQTAQGHVLHQRRAVPLEQRDVGDAPEGEVLLVDRRDAPVSK